MLASISLNAGCSIKYASYNRYRSNVVLKNEKLRLSPKYSLCSLGSTSFGRRGYIIKPLTVENHFPKFEKPVDPPTELKFKKSEKALYVKWNDGCEVKLPAEYLRVESPSAEVQGHGGAHEKRLIFGRKFVTIIGVEPQGNYGVLLKFDDMHESGIYSWDYLKYLGVNKFSIMKRYILNLRKAGKHRDPRINNAARPKTSQTSSSL